MVEVAVRARWFAKGAARGIRRTQLAFFEEDRGGSRARLGQWDLAPAEPAGRAYLRDGLLLLGVVAAGLLLGRQSTPGGAPPSSPSDDEGTGADATERMTPDPAGVPGPASGPSPGPAGGPSAGGPVPRRAEPQDAVPPAPPSLAEPPPPENPIGRSSGEDLERAPAGDVHPVRSSGAPSGEGAATAEEPPTAQEAEQPSTEETASIAEELPPPPQPSHVELPPPPQASEAELPPPPSTPDVAEELPPPPAAEEVTNVVDELPPPPEVEEVELPPPPPASESIIDELPPPPVPEEQNVGDAPSPPEPSVEPAAEAPRAEEPQVRKRVTATTAARRKARELGVDLLEVEGTGKNGKITVDDVVRSSGEQERP